MTYTIPSESNHLPIHKPVRSINRIELYSLFLNGQRVSDNAYSMKLAYRVFVDRLIANPELKIKKVSVRSSGVNLRYGR